MTERRVLLRVALPVNTEVLTAITRAIAERWPDAWAYSDGDHIVFTTEGP